MIFWTCEKIGGHVNLTWSHVRRTCRNFSLFLSLKRTVVCIRMSLGGHCSCAFQPVSSLKHNISTSNTVDNVNAIQSRQSQQIIVNSAGRVQSKTIISWETELFEDPCKCIFAINSRTFNGTFIMY